MRIVSFIVRSGIVSLALLWPLRLSATEWSVTPRVKMSAEVNDNKRLIRSSVEKQLGKTHDPVVGGLLDLSAEAAMNTESTKLYFSPRAVLSRYTRDGLPGGLSSENFYIDFGGTHALNERLTIGLRGNYTYDTTLTSELQTTGRTQSRFRRSTIDLNPTIAYATSERNTVQGGINYTNTMYESQARQVGLLDYLYQGVYLADTYKLNDKEEVSATVSANRFEPANVTSSVLVNGKTVPFQVQKSTTDNLSFEAGYSRKFSESLKGSVEAGVIHTRTDTKTHVLGNFLGTQTTSDLGFLFDISATKTFERAELSAGFSRRVIPSGFGSQITQNELRVAANHKFSERFNGGLNLLWDDNHYTANRFSSIAPNEYQRAEPYLRYQLTPFWYLMAQYIYSRSSRSDSSRDDTTDSNAFLFSVGYDGEKIISISR
jgi:hypothetical protein